jgi:hypothetical protein
VKICGFNAPDTECGGGSGGDTFEWDNIHIYKKVIVKETSGHNPDFVKRHEEMLNEFYLTGILKLPAPTGEIEVCQCDQEGLVWASCVDGIKGICRNDHGLFTHHCYCKERK